MNRQQIEQLSKIADAALELYAGWDIPDDKLTVMMDLEHAHDAAPLDLDAMLSAATRSTVSRWRYADFVHDMLGIRRHINRATGQLENCFSPRFTMPATLADCDPQRDAPYIDAAIAYDTGADITDGATDDEK